MAKHDGSLLDCSISSALTTQKLQSCAEPSNPCLSQSRLEALNQIVELLSMERDQEKEEFPNAPPEEDFSSLPSSLAATSLLTSVHLQFLGGCFGLNVISSDVATNTQLYHYQVGC